MHELPITESADDRADRRERREVEFRLGLFLAVTIEAVALEKGPYRAAKLPVEGRGSVGAKDTTDYAAFMRQALRTSLKANNTTTSLGFRCAKSIP